MEPRDGTRRRRAGAPALRVISGGQQEQGPTGASTRSGPYGPPRVVRDIDPGAAGTVERGVVARDRVGGTTESAEVVRRSGRATSGKLTRPGDDQRQVIAEDLTRGITDMMAITGRSPADVEASSEAFAKAIVLRQLGAGPRSRAQLAERLASRYVEVDVANRVLDRLQDVGLVDDVEFARTWVHNRRAKGLSVRALTRELIAKGVDRDVADAAVEAVDPEAEQGAAETLARKRLASMRGLPRETQVRRLAGVLARKGYSSELTMRVVYATVDAVEPEDNG